MPVESVLAHPSTLLVLLAGLLDQKDYCSVGSNQIVTINEGSIFNISALFRAV